MGKIIGIDLGTTNSVVAIMEGKEPKVITNEEGHRLTPSVVAFDDKGEVLVGQIARRQAITNPENTVYSVKRFIGRRFEEVTDEQKRVPYKVVKGAHGDPAVEIRGIPAFRLEVVDVDDPVEVGARTQYRIDVTNQGSLPGNEVEIVCEVPRQMRILGASGPRAAELRALYDHTRGPAQRADLLRYAILRAEGGVYLDVDTVTLRPFTPLLAGTTPFCGVERIVYPDVVRRSKNPFVRGAAHTRAVVREVLRRVPRGWRQFRAIEGAYPVAANQAFQSNCGASCAAEARPCLL